MNNIETQEEKSMVGGPDEPVTTESELRGKPSSEAEDKAGPQNKDGAKGKLPTPDRAIAEAIGMLRTADTLDWVSSLPGHARSNLADGIREEAFAFLEKYGGEEWKKALDVAKE